MPVPPDEFYARATASAGPDGRLPTPTMAYWEIFPFETTDLTVVPLAPPQVPEAPRHGAGGVGCSSCAPRDDLVWRDERWGLRPFGAPSGVPLRLLLVPHEHVDLPALSDALAAELGVLVAHVARAVESLPHVARAHVNKWGDGAEHLHVFFYARPEGMRQMLGTLMPLWDDVLPPVPLAERDADARAVAAALVRSYGGTAVG